jgi:hypothetical protein
VIFAREINGPVTSLVKKIDAATAKNSSSRMASFAVFLSDQEGLDKKLKDLADKEKVKKTALTIDNPAGPESYKIAKDADVTVLLYVKKNVKANYAFKKGELKDNDIEKIVTDLSKILPESASKGS